jgi:hypothetical protein
VGSLALGGKAQYAVTVRALLPLTKFGASAHGIFGLQVRLGRALQECVEDFLCDRHYRNHESRDIRKVHSPVYAGNVYKNDKETEILARFTTLQISGPFHVTELILVVYAKRWNSQEL